MSNARGRRDGMPYNFPRQFRQPSWQDQSSSYFQNSGWAENRNLWNMPQQSFGAWDGGPQNNNNMIPQRPPWPRQCFPGPAQPFEQFAPRFQSPPFSSQNGPPFTERSLAHITQPPLEDHSINGRSPREGRRVLSKPIHQSTSPNKQLNAKICNTQDSSSSNNPAGNSPLARNSPAPKTGDRPNPLAQKASLFKTPNNDDLRSIVKESLKSMNRGGTSPAQSAPEESGQSPRRARESRIPSGDQSQTRRPSGDAPGRRPSGEFSGSPRTPTGTRRRAQSQSSTDANPSSLLDELGYIQRTGDQSASPSVNQTNDEEPLTISREQLNQYLRSMDNQQRRQLVEQPRDSISKSLLDHLVQENQTNRARQLSSLRFRVSSTEMELTSKNESHVMLSDQLFEEIKELLAQQDAEDAQSQPVRKSLSSRPEDDEIEIIEPPPKTPPICIDLDCDDSPSRSEAPKKRPELEGKIKQQPSLDTPPVEVNQTVVEPTPTEPASEPASQGAEPVVAEVSHSPAEESEKVAPPEKQPEPQETMVETQVETPVETPVETQVQPLVESPPTEEKNTMLADSQCSTEPNSSVVQENDAVTQSVSSTVSELNDLPSLSCENWPMVSSTAVTNERPAESEPQLVIESVTSLAQSEVSEKPAEEQRPVEVRQPEEEPLFSRLMRLHGDEQRDLLRLSAIEQMITELQNERRLLTELLLSRKQEQFDLLQSAQQKNSDSQPVSSAPSTTAGSNSPKTVTSPRVLDTSARLLDLALQLGQNGVQVSLGSTLIPGKPVESSAAPKKRKRAKTTPAESEAKKASTTEESGSKAKKASSSKRKSTSTPSKSPPPPVASEPAKKKRKSTGSKTWDVSASPLKIKTSKSKESSSTSKSTEPTEDASQKDSSNKKQVNGPESSQKETTSNPEPSVQPPQPVAIPSKVTQDSGPSRSSPLPSSQAQTKVTSPVKQPKPTESNQHKTTSKEVPQVVEILAEKSGVKRSEPCDSTGGQSEKPKEAKLPRGSEPEPQTTANRPNVVPVPIAAPAASSTSTSSTQNALNTTPGLPGLLEPHGTCVRTMFVNGPGLFTASDDGTVHVYDHTTGILTMRVLGHQEPVTFLYAVSLKKTSQQLRECPSTAQYLNNLNLITGSLDGFVRQFSLETGNVLHERNCHAPVTCAAANKKLQKLYVGTKRGDIFSYDPKSNGLAPARFKAQGEVITMKTGTLKSKKILAVCAVERNVAIYDCATEERLMTLSTGFQNNTIRNIATCGTSVLYCCDSNKRVFTFDLANERPLMRIDDLPSVAVSCHLYNSKFLFLACQDGAIRVIDVSKKSRNSITLTGTNPKTMSCMRFSDSKIICGTLAGEVFCRAIPRFAGATQPTSTPNGASKK